MFQIGLFERCYSSRERFSKVTCFFVVLLSTFMLQISVGMAFDDSWIAKIRPDHPRLFFNRDTLPRVRERALTEERKWYTELKRMVNGYPDNPTAESRREDSAYRKKPDGSYGTVRLPRPADWGSQAAHTAFVYLVTDDKKYLEKTKKMLDVSVSAYHECFGKGMAVSLYSTSRVHWLAEYKLTAIPFPKHS